MSGQPFFIPVLAMIFACEADQKETDVSENEPNGDTGEQQTAPSGPTLSVTATGAALTELAAEAVALAPSWVQGRLSLTLGLLDEEDQDELAALIVDIDDHYLIDEVAFSIAHLSPEVLSNSDFYPEILVENAELVYARDADLTYVELVDDGEPGTDADYFTTATYLIEDEDGKVVERTIKSEIYYWYLVHPRMEDEYPYYIDGWENCNGSECASTPEEGSTWRAFLWDEAQDECPKGRECPVLKDYMTKDVDVLWKSKAYDRSDNGAIGAVINWEMDAITFGAGDERPIQPNRIYAVGCGNCGEWADMATAAARSVLIPSQNVGAYANDHTWNEFWDDGWQQWEPVNTYVLHWTYYVDSDGDYGRTYDSIDNDCDGSADEGLSSQPGSGSDDNSDADGDGWTIADGDCDDTDDSIYPEATEDESNLRDDDCDGIADDGTDKSDADGDGVTIADGDCDDTNSSTYPGADDPPLSTNRLFAISAARGDARISSDRTEAYGRPTYLEFLVTDDEDRPVDGAVVSVYGNWAVYGYPEYGAWATEGVTDPDGVATIMVGEANPYGFAVESAVGTDPDPGYYYGDVVEWTEPGETYSFSAEVDGAMPDLPEPDEADVEGDVDVSLAWSMSVSRAWVASDGVYRGTAHTEHTSANLDVFVLDADNYQAFDDGDDFEAVAHLASASEGSDELGLTSDQEWFLVVANVAYAATTIEGSLDASISAQDADWESDSDSVSSSFLLGAGQHLAVSLTPTEDEE